MDRDIINRKLESLRRCIARLESKRPSTPGALQSDDDLQDIIALNLQRAVQICADIAAHLISDTELSPPRTMGEGFELLAESHIIPSRLAANMQKAVAFRDILVHNYTNINWHIVAGMLADHLTDFVQFAQAIDQMNNQGPLSSA